MERRSFPKNVSILCRICLTSSKNLSHLVYPVEDMENLTIHQMLESVTSKRVKDMIQSVPVRLRVVLDDKKLPSKICQMCLSLLKLSYDFQAQFTNSQNTLKQILKESPVETIENTEMVEEEEVNNVGTPAEPAEPAEPPAPVELIYGSAKYDLKDVIVIQEEETENATFEGFLNNLGTEISAKFVNSKTKKPRERPRIENDVVIEPLRPQTIEEAAPEPVVEEEFCNVTTIVKTLYQCRRCQSLFETNSELEMHLEMCYNNPIQLMCDKCGHLAHSQSALYHHLQKHKGKRFRCDQCDKAYLTTTRLKTHLEVHKNERRFLCNVCGKNFNYKVALKYHMRLHTGEKKYVCNYCGKNFTMSNALKRHLRTHTRERPYKCSYCERKFFSRGEQKSHEMMHTGETPYHCQYCDKAFTKASNLQYHCLSHSGPHECSLCPKTFVDIKFLRIHLKKAHQGMVDGDELDKEMSS